MSRKNRDQLIHHTQTNSNVVSMDEFLERKNYQGEIEYSSIDTFYTLDVDDNEITVSLNDE